MGDVKLPRQVALVRELFPKDFWAQSLVTALNQFALEVVQAFRFAQPQYKTLGFSIGSVTADSFPIDFPVESSPVDVWVAAVPVGDITAEAVTVKWQPIVSNGGLSVRVTLITGLAADTDYTVRLGYR